MSPTRFGCDVEHHCKLKASQSAFVVQFFWVSFPQNPIYIDLEMWLFLILKIAPVRSKAVSLLTDHAEESNVFGQVDAESEFCILAY